jgi:hypothetical protein
MTTFFAQAPTTVGATKTHSAPRALLVGMIFAIAFLGAMAYGAAAAHADADTGSGNFLGALSSKGIRFTSPQAVIATARQVCEELDSGKQTSDVANEVMAQTNLDGYHAGYFIGASIGAMCPRHSQ